MIIAIDARPLLTNAVGGAEQYARNIVGQWAVRETPHKFLLFFDRGQAATEAHDMLFVERLPPAFEAVEVRGMHISGLVPMGQLSSSLGRAVSRRKADVFLSFTPTVPRLRACPVVQTIHDLSFELDPAVRATPEGSALRHAARAGAKWATHIVALSGQTRGDIADLYGVATERVSVIANGINPVFVPTNDPAKSVELKRRYAIHTPFVLVVGSDIPRRNYARVLDAMCRLWRTHPHIGLLPAGRNCWPDSPVYARAAAEGVLGKMIFVQAPTDEDLAQLYRDALFTCCGSSFEGFGISVLEAMACGNPVACSDMQSLHEVAEDAALYFAHDDPQSMYEVFIGLVEDPDYRRKLRVRGLARARNFTWSASADELLRLLERVASP